jgi:uncharacterized protein YciI
MTAMPPEVALSELTGDQLRVRVARAQFYLIHFNRPNTAAGESEAASSLRDHLAYLYKLEAEGRLYAYGPLEVRPEDPARELAFVAAASREEAEKIAASDPLQVAGFRDTVVQGHTMNEGVACYVGRAMSRRALAVDSAFNPGIEGIELSYVELTGRARSAQVYLIHLDPTDKFRPPEDTATFDAHFVWLRDNEMAARLLSCGPVEPPRALAPGVWGGGLGVVATSRGEAEAIAAREPSGLAGYRKLSVRGWTVQYGLAAPIAEALQALNALPDA